MRSKEACSPSLKRSCSRGAVSGKQKGRPAADVEAIGLIRSRIRDAVRGRTFLKAKDLDVGYAPGFPIVRRVSFELLRGERMALFGENGTGKTTLW